MSYGDTKGGSRTQKNTDNKNERSGIYPTNSPMCWYGQVKESPDNLGFGGPILNTW